MFIAIKDFAFTPRARRAVQSAVRQIEPVLPARKILTAFRKPSVREFLTLEWRSKSLVEKFEYQPRGWYVPHVFIKDGRARVHFFLRYAFVRESDGKEFDLENFPSEHYKGGDLPPAGELHTFNVNLRGVDTGVVVFPFDEQQSRFLLKKETRSVWGIKEDLQELARAPAGLFR